MVTSRSAAATSSWQPGRRALDRGARVSRSTTVGMDHGVLQAFHAGGLAERCMAMLFIGLLIALAAAAFAAVVLAENWGGATYTIHGFGATLGNLTLAEIFLAGIILTAIFFIALWLASVSSLMRRRASERRRAEHRTVREEREALLADRDRLARELESERGRNVDLTDRTAAYPKETYPRDTEVYGDRGVTDPEARRHTV